MRKRKLFAVIREKGVIQFRWLSVCDREREWDVVLFEKDRSITDWREKERVRNMCSNLRKKVWERDRENEIVLPK